jgi:4-hydroxy-4-methyl-2-oxoglutarate aldolase
MHGDGTGAWKPGTAGNEEDVVADPQMRPEDEAAALAALGSATLGESGGLAADRRLRPAWPGASIAAPAYPVGCTPGDNLAVHVGVTKAPRGSVLVVDVGQVADRGYWGEVLTTAAEAAGLAGLVLDGCVRDVGALEAHGFPVFSAGIALTGASKDKPGTVGRPVRVGGVVVSAGDWVVADVDGVTFVPAGALGEVLAAGRAREAKEAGFFEALRGGRTTVELLGLDASLIADEPG